MTNAVEAGLQPRGLGHVRRELMKLRMGVLVAMLALTGATLARAQETTGTVTGRVTDAQGLAIPGVDRDLDGTARRQVVHERFGRSLQRAAARARHVHRQGGTARLQDRRAAERGRPSRTDHRGAARDAGRRHERDGRGHRVLADRRYEVDDRRRGARQRDAREHSSGPPLQRHAVRRAGRHQQRQCRQRRTRRWRVAAASTTRTWSMA